ncbi:RNA polymerase subunit sigma-24 [Aerococcaceae bacterium zg-BR22]|uniref:RNA polymerase subunit sigma-24 n=1 Tax=Aerococcaceae bacterium zg-1292 TaxID=2774330 RepID=UPI004064B67F|nr:RNA polymerase subunit sigma-24 [Aerococcaceae bacterium zg-BR22]
MKIRKTRSDNRTVYKYQSVDGSVCILTAGSDGVSELDIKKLHSLDDSEVNRNNNNLRPKRTKVEKKMIEEWKQEFIKKFKERHGYEPNEQDVNYFVEEVFPRNYNLSIDSQLIDFDKSKIGLLTSEEATEDFYWSDRMQEAMDKFRG